MAVAQLPMLPTDRDGALDTGALDLLQRPHLLFDPARRCLLHANPAALRLWGLPALDAFGTGAQPGLDTTVQAKLAAAALRLGSGGVVREELGLHREGHPVMVEALISGVRLPDGRLVLLVEGAAVTTDALRAVEVVRHMPVLVSLYDAEGTALFRNPAAARAYPGGSATFSTAFADPIAARALWDQVWAGTPASAELVARTGAGRCWHRVDARPAADPVTGQACILVNEQDIQAEVATRAEIEHRATHDGLTKLANRTLFRRRLDDAASEAEREGRPFSVLLVDLDKFKAVNDTLGHEAGDMLLCEASCRMHEVVRRSDTLARLGGDEFGVLLPGLGCRARAADVAAALIRHIGSDYKLNGAKVRIGASVGVALHDGARKHARTDGRYGTGAPLTDELIRAADRALYGAKSAGRNTFRLAA